MHPQAQRTRIQKAFCESISLVDWSRVLCGRLVAYKEEHRLGPDSVALLNDPEDPDTLGESDPAQVTGRKGLTQQLAQRYHR